MQSTVYDTVILTPGTFADAEYGVEYGRRRPSLIYLVLQSAVRVQDVVLLTMVRTVSHARQDNSHPRTILKAEFLDNECK